MLENRARGQHYLASGLVGPKHQALVPKILAHLLKHGYAREYLSSFGVGRADSGRQDWVRPAPPRVIAMLLGIGPPDNPGMGRPLGTPRRRVANGAMISELNRLVYAPPR